MKKFIPLIYSLFLLVAPLAKAQTYQLWGTTNSGGLNDAGVIMNLTEDSDQLTLSYSFGSPTGEYPTGNLLYGKDSIFYGMTPYDGADSEGVLFSYNPLTGIYTDLVDFDGTNGSYPLGSLIQDTTTGVLYGMTSLGGAHNFGVIFSYNPDSLKYKDIHDFDSVSGEAPNGTLLWGKNDTTYGLTSLGGIYNDGVLFYYIPNSHIIKKLYDFNDTLGLLPSGALIRDSTTLYGMTPYGGANDDGVIFSFNLPDSSYTDLLDFNYANGSNPSGSLFKAPNGKLYGMTENGVDSVSDGVIFSYNPDSNMYSVLYVFSDSIGANPSGSFIQAHNGKLYATTQFGGVYDHGVIFSFNPDSIIYTDVYNFNNGIGGTPCGDLTETPYIMNVTGIPSVTAKDQFSIFPNPSSGLITVISPTVIDAVRITDLLGRVVYTSTPKQTNLTLDIKETGMFFITLTSSTQTTTSKIIISK